MRKAFRASALALILSCPAFAGIIHTPSAQPTPTPTPTNTIEESEGGEIHNPVTVEEVAVTLLQSALSLL